MEYFEIQDIYHKRMKEDYEKGVVINPFHKPYFLWKFYGEPIESLTKQKCYAILEEAPRELEELDIKHPNAHEHLLEESTTDDVWKPYKGYGEDCYLYSYLIGIESEITNILFVKWG